MRARHSLLITLCWLVSVAAGDEVTIATWNCDQNFGRDPLREELDRFEREIDADVLLLQEISSRTVLNRLLIKMGRDADYIALSSFGAGSGDHEVAIVSRYEIELSQEFDRSTDGGGPNETRLERPDERGVADVGVGRGFLVAHIPELKLIAINSHLKSSRGRGGIRRDGGNAQKRELVAAAVAVEAARLREDYPEHTIVFGGDINVGVSDASKNGVELTNDRTDGYDDTHAILSLALVPGTVPMKNLAAGLPSTFRPGGTNPFPASGAIDALYAVGPLVDSGALTAARVGDETYGSDHLPVYAKASLPIDRTEDADVAAEEDDPLLARIEALEQMLAELREAIEEQR